jgi:hypothetical protein
VSVSTSDGTTSAYEHLVLRARHHDADTENWRRHRQQHPARGDGIGRDEDVGHGVSVDSPDTRAVDGVQQLDRVGG